MRLFYYVHTGHRIGLDRFRRAAAIIKGLGDVDITLLTSDYRIASEAKNYGIKRSVGIDVVRNIPQIAQKDDAIIFDSAEHNPTMLEDMTQFFSIFIRISDNPHDVRHPKEFLISPYLEGENICKAIVVDPQYFEAQQKQIDRCFFFGDDDYEKDLEKHLEMFREHKMDLGIGFYYFIGYEEILASAFGNQHEFEDYERMIKTSDVLVSASPQAVLENLASLGRPIFLQRPDYPQDFLQLFTSLNIPIVNGYDQEALNIFLTENISQKYHMLPNDTPKVLSFLKETLTL